MILGCGIDVVDVGRVDRLLRERGERLLGRVLTERERRALGRSRRPALPLARRIAAKEAAMKALGTGWAGGVGFRQVEALADAEHPSRLRLALHGRAEDLARALGADRIHLAVGGSRERVVAIVTLETTAGANPR